MAKHVTRLYAKPRANHMRNAITEREHRAEVTRYMRSGVAR